MAFTTKDWKNNDPTTPLDAAGLEDLETRLSDYTDDRTPVGIPAQYGAAGDGVTDDTTELQDCVDENSLVDLADGIYLVDSTFEIPADTHVRGPGTIKLKASAAASKVVSLGARARISNLKIDGNKANVSATGTGAVEIENADDVIVENVWIDDANSYGIRVVDSSRVAVRNSRITDADAYGIFVVAVAAECADFEATGNTISTAAETYGIVVHGDNVGTLTARRARIAQNAVSLPTAPSVDCIGIEVWGYAPESTITGNTVLGGRYGISVNASNFTAVSGNAVRAPSVWGIEIANSSACAVTGNTVDGNSSTDLGIAWSGTSNSGLASGNVVRDTISKAIHFNACARAVATGNFVKSAAGDGIYFQSGPDAVASGNYVDLNGGAGDRTGIVFDGAHKVAVTGNLLRDPSYAGINLVATSGTFTGTITGNEITTAGTRIFNNVSGGGAIGALRIADNAPYTVPSVASAATVTLPLEADVVTVSGTADITSITASHAGRRVTLIFSGTAATTGLTDGSNLKLASSLGYTADDSITLVCDGTNWIETGRSVN